MKKMNIIATVASTVLLASCLVATGSALVIDEVNPSRSNAANAETNSSHLWEGNDFIYFKPNSYWLTDNARFCVYAWEGNLNEWFSLNKSTEDNPATVYNESTLSGFYSASTEGMKKYSNFKFVRMNGSTTDNNWDNKYNETANLTFSSYDYCYSTIILEEKVWDNSTPKASSKIEKYLLQTKNDGEKFVRVWFQRNGHYEQDFDYYLAYKISNKELHAKPAYQKFVGYGENYTTIDYYLVYFDIPRSLFDMGEDYTITFRVFNSYDLSFKADAVTTNLLYSPNITDNRIFALNPNNIKEVWRRPARDINEGILTGNGYAGGLNYEALATILSAYDSCSSDSYFGWGALSSLETVWNINNTDKNYLNEVSKVTLQDKEYNGQTVFTCKDKIEQLYKTEPKQLPNKQLKGIVSDDPIQNLTLAGLALTSVTALVIAVSLKKRKVLSK